MINKKCKKAFSLIELIVVITIIMVVSMIGIVSYQGANYKARDGKRMSDLEKIRVALEMYRQEYGYYPLSASSSLVSDYLQSWPEDPKGGSYYYNRSIGTSYSYTIDAQVEGVGDTTGSYGDNCGSSGICNYRVTNP